MTQPTTAPTAATPPSCNSSRAARCWPSWRGSPPPADQVAWTAARLRAVAGRLAQVSRGDLLEGRL